MRYPTFSSTLALLSLAACANVTQHKTVTANTTKQAPALTQGLVSNSSIQGTWKTACSTDSTTKSVFITTLTFQNAVLTSDTLFFGDPNCAFAISREQLVNNFDLTDIGNNYQSLKETLVLAKYQAMNSVIADLFNQNAKCGIKNWVAGIDQTFTDVSVCPELSKTVAYHATLFGSTELYLDDCTTPGGTGNCQSIRYVRLDN